MEERWRAVSNMLTIYSMVADFFMISTTVKSRSSIFFWRRLITTIISILVKYSSALLPRLAIQLFCS